MNNLFKRGEAYACGLCVIALAAVIGCLLVTCSNGLTDSDAVIDPKWHGTYKSGDDIIVVSADTVRMPSNAVLTVRSDEGIANDGSHHYMLKQTGLIFLRDIYFFDGDTIYLKTGSNPNFSPKYEKTP